MTRNTLTVRDLVSNRALQSVIEAWCVANRVQRESEDDDDKEMLLTCTFAEYHAAQQKTSSKQVLEAIIDRAWKKRAEIRNIPHFQSSVELRR